MQEGTDMAGAPFLHKMGCGVVGDGEAFPQVRVGARAGGEDAWWRHRGNQETLTLLVKGTV